MLSVVDYGILASLFAIIYILGIFSESIQLVLAKYTSNVKDKGKVKNILNKSLKKTSVVSVVVLAIYLILAAPLSIFLKIEYPLMALNGLIIFSVFLNPVTRGILQGTKKFKALGGNMIIESVVKLGLAVLFVFIGWKVYGAITGALIGTFLALFVSFSSLRDIMKSKESSADTKGIYGYTKPALLTMFVIIAFYSIDVIFAKILFDEVLAGSYAIASTLAKTLFFGTQPIGRAMFPLSAESKSNKSKSDNVFLNAFGIVLLISLVGLGLFYFFPTLIIKIFSGEAIAGAISVLFLVGLAVTLVSFANLVLLYKLSVGKIKGYKNLVIFLIVECLLFWKFSGNLIQFSL
ncbi:MAG: oligosaccharide flippase family protein, partial [Nanoarchaeota archaeon]|nr:oligosaccharide flippase family protein [Nanoarchaeota archaeon]